MPQNPGTPVQKQEQKEKHKGRKKEIIQKTTLLSMSKSIVKGKVKEPKASKACLNSIYLRCEKPRTPAPGPKTLQRRRHIFRNSKQWLEPKKLLTLEGSESKTPCAMIKISAWQRLCVYSPEVTGSCLLTSVASTMEPRKVRKLKVLTGFRPVSDQFHTLRPACLKTMARLCKRKEQREKHKGRKKEIIQKPDCCQCQSQKLKEK